MDKFKLRDYQIKAVKDILHNFKKHNSQILSFYTGAGKTEIFFEVINKILAKDPNAKIGVSCHWFLGVKMQTYERAKDKVSGKVFLVDRHKKIAKTSNVYFFNPSLMIRRDNKFKFDYMIVDEFHYGYSEKVKGFEMMFDKWCKPSTKYLFVSATPQRSLGLKRTIDAPIVSRGLDDGYKIDKAVSDFDFNFQRIDIKVKSKDVNKFKNLKEEFIAANFKLLTELYMKTLKDFIEKNALGDKVLICVPGGDSCRIAQVLAGYLRSIGEGAIAVTQFTNKTEFDFKDNPGIRFAIVVNKCQEAFDFPELSDVVDLTMTRNIRLLTQRIGRLARKHPEIDNKKYWYLFDESISPMQAEWLYVAAIDSASGMSIRENMKSYRVIDEYIVRQRNNKTFRFTISLKEKLLKYPKVVTKGYKEMTFSDYRFKDSRKWSVSLATQLTKKYKTRTELSVGDRSCYNYLIKNHPVILDEIYPKRVKQWNLKKSLEVAAKCRTRQDMKNRFGGAYSFICENNLLHKLDEVLPSQLKKRWSKSVVLETAKEFPSNNVSNFKHFYMGAYHYACRKGFTKELREIFDNKKINNSPSRLELSKKITPIVPKTIVTVKKPVGRKEDLNINLKAVMEYNDKHGLGGRRKR